MLTWLKVSLGQEHRQRFIKYGGISRDAACSCSGSPSQQGGKGSRQMRNANDEIMKKPSPKTKQSLQAAKALKPKVVEHKNKVLPQVCEAQPHRADPCSPPLLLLRSVSVSHCLCVWVRIFNYSYALSTHKVQKCMKKPSTTTTTTLQTRQKFSCQAWQLVVNKMTEGQWVAVRGSEGQWWAVRGRASVAWEIGKCMETTNMKLQA